MEGEDPKGLGPIAAHAGAEAGNGAPGAPAEAAGVSDCGPIGGFNASQSQLVGAAGVAPSTMDKAEANVVGVKRKRGRPPKNQGKLPPPPPKKKPKEDEDVCFICFDGGSLVLCDRRDCPKAYHPACVKRDEAFFNTRAKWNCGWHICSICQKTSHYMCYTCTYSLCKACTKDSDYLCVRENKGFCTTCMGTIMLIEKKDHGDKETVHVDFDDKTSWEYLFKVYWVYMKEKLSLTFEELTRAQNPWKAAAVVVPKVQPLDIHSSPSNGNNSILAKPSGQPGAYNLRENRTKGYSDLSHEGDSPSTDQSVCENGHPNVETADWASKELLEFIAFTKNGDVSELSHFEVQTLLLDYIKRNSLRDPRRKSQIICDSKLINLFGKVRVGHFEMLKLLEFHFTAKEDHQKDVTQGNKNTSATQVEGNGNSDSLLMKGKYRKRKTPPKGEDSGLLANLDDYAAIDVHNINLIYLRRNLLENLVKENVKFHDKVVGSIVRIRIPCGDQKQNMHRLVLVAGTCKAAEPYKIGEVTSDVMLEILNLNKKETIAIDAISNQEFSEDECKRLRQSIKYGLVKRLTVGQVLEKAIVLQEVRLNDWLEGELIRLNHLRDRASEKGQKKQLRECVEKIELLKSPEERQRRLQAAPEVHMDPNCESDEDDGLINNKKRDESVTPRYHEDSRNGWDPPCIQNGDLSTGIGIKNSGSVKPVNRVKSAGLFPSTGIIPREARQRILLPTNPIINESETEMLWHYRDPNGNVQGPFCMIQLRKWNTTGYFPLDMRVWRVNDVEADSLLMTDLLSGKVKRVLPQQSAIPSLSQETRGVSDIASQHREGGVSGSVNIKKMEGNNGVTANSNGENHKIANASELVAHSSSPSRPVTNNSGVQTESQNSPSEQVHCPATSVPVTERLDETSLHQVRIDEGETQNSAPSSEQNLPGNVMSATTEGQNHDNQSNNDDHSGSASMPKSTDSQEKDLGDAALPNLPSSTPEANGEAEVELPEKVAGQNLITPNLNSPAQKFCEEDEKTEGSFQNVASPSTHSANEDEKAVDSNQNAPSPTLAQTEKAEASIQDERGSMPEPSKEEDVKAVDSVTRSIQTPVLNSTREDEKTEIQNDLNPTPKCASEDEKAETSMKKNEPTSPPAKSTNEAEKVELSENKYFVPNFPPVQHSGTSWSNTSDLSEWGGYSSAGPKPSLEEWNAGLVLSSLKPPAAASTVHASTPVSGGDEFTPPSHPASTSSWQTMVAEPIEFSTLAEESVSDLLAEVEVMESQREFASSPTSRMTCIEELFEYSKSDYFNSFGGLSPPLESGRSDSSCSTGDLQLPTQLTMTIQPVEAPRADVADLQKKHDREAKPTYTSQHEPDTFLTRLLLAPCTMSGGTMHETMRPIQGGSSTQAVTDMGCAFSSGMSDLGVNRNDLGLRMKHGNMSLRQEQPTQRAANLECTVSSGMFDLGGDPNHVGSRRSTQGCTVSSDMFDLGVDPNNVGSRTTKNERTSPHVFDLGGDPNHGGSRRSTQGCNVSSGMFDLGGDPNNVGSRTTKNERTSTHERGFSLTQGGPVSNMGCTVSMGMTDLGANPNDIGSRTTNEQHMDPRQGRSSAQGVPKLGDSGASSRTTMHGQMSPRRGGSSSIQGGGNANMGWLTGHGGGNANMNRSPPAGSSVRRESHPVERHAGGSQRDRAHRGGGSGERSSAWSSRQSAFGGGSTGSGGGGGSGGSYPRQSPRGQRVCKFYESGYCRKGAFCDYLHPS